MYVLHGARDRLPTGPQLRPVDPAVAAVTVALFELGGSADEGEVAEHIARQDGLAKPTPADRARLAMAFADHSASPVPYFESCLEPDGRRWRLTERGQRLFAAKPLATFTPVARLGQPT